MINKVILTREQIRSIHALAVTAAGTIRVEQEKPGRFLHTYMVVGGGRCHVAKNGNVVWIGKTDEAPDE